MSPSDEVSRASWQGPRGGPLTAANRSVTEAMTWVAHIPQMRHWERSSAWLTSWRKCLAAVQLAR
jgi:hypothetical protein